MNIAKNLHCGRKLTKLSFWVVKNRQQISTTLFYRVYKFQFVRRKYILFSKTLYLKRDYMDLSSVIKIFEDRVPTYLAESWDNTGLLIDSNKTEVRFIILLGFCAYNVISLLAILDLSPPSRYHF